MKVAIAIPAWTRAYGGPVAKIGRLLPELDLLGVEARIVSSDLAAPAGRHGRELRRIVGPEPDMRVWRQHTVAAWRWSPWIHWRDPDWQPDLVHVLGAWNGLSYAAIGWARRLKVPLLWEPAGMLGEAGRHPWLRRLRHLHPRLPTPGDGVLLTSRAEAREGPVWPDGIRVWRLPNPVPAPGPEAVRLSRSEVRATLAWPREGPHWGYLGRIAARKGLRRLLRAWQAAGRPGRLWLAGPVEDRSLATALRAGGARLTGALDPVARDRFLRAIDVLVLVPAGGENFGNVVAEAVLLGTPAWTSPAVGATEWLPQACRILANETDLQAAFRSGPPAPLSGQAVAEAQRVLDPARVAAERVALWRKLATGPDERT